ncbi:membrane protein [Jeotgalibacillus soli]|uniref:Transporter n=1 Tax=Jeotgalibacillus soli TaxID=889306 RepID=A0A0C2RNK1_9BACL|nr:membrane protein [Jeotgalibacillus soli]KIL51855.1 hypothetical protein KP78_02250 [Jeotgalibacillus soli]
MTRGWIHSFQVAAVYVGTVVGAGFATGKEIVEFFTQYGLLGIAGILVAGLLFIFMGVKMMILSKRINATSYQDLNRFLFGRHVSKVINLFMLAVLLGVTSIMLSGAGAVFEEQLGLSKQIGIGSTVILALFVMVFGVKGLLSVNVLVVPMLVVFSIAVAVQSTGTLHLMTPENPASAGWILSALSYSAFNITMAAAVLVPLANEIKDEKVLKRGGIVGGILLMLILISSHIALSSLPNVAAYDVPMAEMMKTIFAVFYFVYVVVIYGEIFTSVIGNLFGLERQLIRYFNIPRMMMILGILLVAVVISQVGYSALLTLLYPLFGKICLVVLVLLMFKKIPNQG